MTPLSRDTKTWGQNSLESSWTLIQAPVGNQLRHDQGRTPVTHWLSKHPETDTSLLCTWALFICCHCYVEASLKWS